MSFHRAPAIAVARVVAATAARLCITCALCVAGTAAAQQSDDTTAQSENTTQSASGGQLRDYLLAECPSFAALDANASEHRLQILVGEVVDTGSGESMLVQHGYRVDAEYFYPASAIKLVGALLALNELQNLENDAGTHPTIDTRIVRHHRAPVTMTPEETAAHVGEPLDEFTIRRSVEAALIRSSNSSFNRLYDTVGHERLNRGMWEAGYTSVRINHRLSVVEGTREARTSPRLEYRVSGSDIVRPGVRSPAPSASPEGARTMIGDDYVDNQTGERVSGPMDFSQKNAISLRDLQTMLVDVMEPELLGGARFPISDESRAFLQEVLGRPFESDPEAGFMGSESRYKPLIDGVRHELGTRSRILYANKAGRAYGFHIENAMIKDTQTGRRFYVAVAIYVNDNRTLNDDTYEYFNVSYPFMAELGGALARYFFR